MFHTRTTLLFIVIVATFPPSAGSRTWKDASGKHTTEASLLECKGQTAYGPLYVHFLKSDLRVYLAVADIAYFNRRNMYCSAKATLNITQNQRCTFKPAYTHATLFD